MSTYSLQTVRIARDKGPSEGEHDMVMVMTDGRYQSGHATASLTLEGHDGQPGSCVVFVPATVTLNAALGHDVVQHLFCITGDGTRVYHFSTRDGALSFLHRLYGIEPAPASVSRRVPALLARNVAPFPLPRPTLGATERAAFSSAPVDPAPSGARDRQAAVLSTPHWRQRLLLLAAFDHPQPRNTP